MPSSKGRCCCAEPKGRFGQVSVHGGPNLLTCNIRDGARGYLGGWTNEEGRMTAGSTDTFGEGSATRSNLVMPRALATGYGNVSAWEVSGVATDANGALSLRRQYEARRDETGCAAAVDPPP